MATVNFILQQPYKYSENPDKEQAKEENKKIQLRIKEAKIQARIDPKKVFPVSLLNPREPRIYLFLIIARNNILKVKTEKTSKSVKLIKK